MTRKHSTKKTKQAVPKADSAVFFAADQNDQIAPDVIAAIGTALLLKRRENIGLYGRLSPAATVRTDVPCNPSFELALGSTELGLLTENDPRRSLLDVQVQEESNGD